MAARALKRNTRGEWPVRVRFGQARAARLTLPAGLTPQQARAHEGRLRQIAQLLHNVPESEARLVLNRGVQAQTDATLEKIEAIARAQAAKHAAKLVSLDGATFREIGQAWTKGELAQRYPDHVRLKRSAGHDAQRLTLLYETIGDVPIKAFTLDHAERAMAAISRGRMPATRRQ